MRRSGKTIAKRQPARTNKRKTNKGHHNLVRAAAANTSERISGPHITSDTT